MFLLGNRKQKKREYEKKKINKELKQKNNQNEMVVNQR